MVMLAVASGGGNNYWLDRSTAAPVRCIRDE